jgi:hypothetical protein
MKIGMDYQNFDSFIAKNCAEEQLECVGFEVSTSVLIKIVVSAS